MTWYHSEDHAGRLRTNDQGHLLWQCRKPDQLVAHLKSPLNISSVGDVAEFRILWKSSGQILGPDCRRKLCHDDCVICLAGTGDFRVDLFDSSGGRRFTRDGEGLESDVFKGWRGYQWRFSPHLQAGEPKRWYEPKPDGSRESHTNTRFWKRIAPADRSLLASKKSWSTMGYEPFDGGFDVPQNEFRLLYFKIERQSDTHITVSITLNGKTFTRTDSDPNNQPEKIDTFAIHMPNARPYHNVVLAPAKQQSESFNSRIAPNECSSLAKSNKKIEETSSPDVPTELSQ
ncbi:MAG TPA: hypothetical protein VMW24_08740 [Sedimentisphaerales bacterium]|nr:hypothetical protein [Sedimentisphaerales bacterium]